jgi:hypothetical protein
MLLTGHIGVGKSTELLYLAQEMNAERFVIKCSIAQTFGVHNLDTFSLLLIILEASIRAWLERIGELPPDLIEELVNHLKKWQPKQHVSELSLADTLSELVNQSPDERPKSSHLLALYSQTLHRFALRCVPTQQIATLELSAITVSCEMVLKALEKQAGQSILLIIDDLDKIRDEQTQIDLFLDRAMAWLHLPCSFVATLPLDVLFSQWGRELDYIWGDVQILEPLPVPLFQAEKSLEDLALQFYLNLLRSFEADKVITGLQCRKLAHLSSGLPRQFVRLCSTCVRYAFDASEKHVRDYQINLAQHDLIALWRSRLNEEDYDILASVIDLGANVPKALHLLRDNLLIRDGNADDNHQFRLASWTVKLVETYQQRKLQGKKN